MAMVFCYIYLLLNIIMLFTCGYTVKDFSIRLSIVVHYAEIFEGASIYHYLCFIAQNIYEDIMNKK
jgi:hypothetical protein